VQTKDANTAPPSPTPLYDELVCEYQRARRTVPGDWATEIRVTASRRPGTHSIAPIIRGGVAAVPRQTSRHRGTAEDAQTYY
jgi:hypothetical protein